MAADLRERPPVLRDDTSIATALRAHLNGTAGCSEACMLAWKRTTPPRKALLRGEP